MKATVIIAAVALMISINLFAQDPPRKADKEGSKDYVSISRYQGAIIQEFNVINYAAFFLGLDEPVEKNFMGHGTFFKKHLDIKGKVYNNQYLIPLEEGVLKVYENYKNALLVAGYHIVYTEHNKNSCFYREDYYGELTKFPKGSYGTDCDRDYYYIVAKGVKDSLDVYANLYICPGGNYGQDFVVVNQSVIEVIPLELGLVSADNITKNIEFSGHCIFYDIHFASGSSLIETKSDDQIKQIAAYLNAHKNKKFYIIGHTDNVGNFNTNKSLSENRAKAVMNELIKKYGIDTNQLKAYGVANMCPITSNATDSGKARNRRVEIVEQ